MAAEKFAIKHATTATSSANGYNSKQSSKMELSESSV
jgi:hypothetical protein